MVSGKTAGVVLNPATPLSQIEYVLHLCGIVLIMTVNPGFGGQKFLPEMLPKVAALRRLCDERGLDPVIEVDGGLSGDNAWRVIEAGANSIVAGSAVFHTPDYARAIAGDPQLGQKILRNTDADPDPHRGGYRPRGTGPSGRRIGSPISPQAAKAASRFALSGGSTPRRLYQLLGESPYREAVPWDRVHWFWGDERFVPWDHPDSNYRMAREALLAHVPAPEPNVHPIETTGDSGRCRAAAMSAC